MPPGISPNPVHRLPGGQFPPGTVFPHARLPGSGPILPNIPEIVQIGYDQPIEEMLIPPGIFAKFPRDVPGHPLRVEFPSVTPGNVLEVDWRMNLAASTEDQYYLIDFSWNGVAIVTFDGTEPVFGNPNTFFVSDSWGGSDFDTGPGTDLFPFDQESITGLAAVPIPKGATGAVVEIVYICEGFVVVAGANITKKGLQAATLKVTEINRAVVTQVGPGNALVPT